MASCFGKILGVPYSLWPLLVSLSGPLPLAPVFHQLPPRSLSLWTGLISGVDHFHCAGHSVFSQAFQVELKRLVAVFL